LVGLAIEIGDDGSGTVQHGLFSVIETILNQAKYMGDLSTYFGLGTLCVIFAMTVLIVPVLQSMQLIAMWFLPMNLKLIKRNFLILEILQAWQYCEVFLLTVLIATLNLGEISVFMVNAYCDSLEGFFQFAAQNGLIEVEDAQCFYVDPSLKIGFYILLVACLFLWASTSIVGKATEAVFYERSLDSPYFQLKLSKSLDRFFGISWLMTKCESNVMSESTNDGQEGSSIDVGVLFTPPQSMVGKDISVVALTHKDEVSILSPLSNTPHPL